jgi:ABC-type bacteriocin/lantibiotic exporter with double-glycine peptidase domain
MTLTKVHGAERLELDRRSREVAELGDAGREMVWRNAVYGNVQSGVAAAAGVIVLIIGGWATAAGHMTLGDLLAFYAVVGLLLRQLTVVLTNAPTVLSGYESLDRLDKVLAADDREPYSGTRKIDFDGSVALEGVTFAYDREPVLRDVDLELRPGERVAVVGPNGAGKSTLVSLVLGLYRPQAGRVTAHGVPYADLDLPALRRRIGVVLQDPMVFPGTVAENIAYGRPEATREEIRDAARRAAAEGFIAALTKGYDTQVGDEGQLLSGGQRQRIAVARALLGRPALLILDEPTTYLDEAVMAELRGNLAELPGSPSLLLISHDSTVAGLGDRVYHLRAGRLASAVEAA